MAEVVVSALVNTILDNLNSLPLEEMGLAGSLKTKVENLESSLTTIRAVLHDAEMKQWKSEAIKNWLAKLKQAAYHLEDVLDDFNTDALPCRSKVTTFFSIRNPLLFHLNMARKLKNARQKLDAISGEKSKFHLREAAEEAEIEPMEDRQTSSLVEESEVIGRADEKEKIISMLLTNASHHQDLSVYAICGMGDEDSWSLFKQRAFGMGVNEGYVNLETIGRQIAQRCGGVPLAIKAIASMLCFKSREIEWLRVKDSEIWDLEDEGSRILAVLRSFFQEIKEDLDGTVTCKMHDLIHDVAASIMRQESFAIELKERLKIPKTARHLFVHDNRSSTNIMVYGLNQIAITAIFDPRKLRR
ncbi:hypothetical protein V6N11_076928 [Hibiscus sabdariffa]|uniref:Disease resistance N-terminal domain-containing protein n=1 Tax=Hibiscus sabdariffa TaxID=183260 RepID=A0ABR2TBJ8_9ROSI